MGRRGGLRAVEVTVGEDFRAESDGGQYRQRLAAGQAIGSGAVEGWAKILGLRLKARGARWCRPPDGDPRLRPQQWTAYWAANDA